MYLRKDPHRAFRALVDSHLLVVSFATVGELRAGAIKARWGEVRRASLERILRENYLVLTATDAVVESFAQLQARFAGRLKDGGVNDMWTAACALAQPEPVPLVTNNLSDFQAIAEEFPLTLVHPDL
jgi:predicted nucleic acid-binding protein